MTSHPSPNTTKISQVFDRGTVRSHRDRAARSFHNFNFLHRDVADMLLDRLGGISRPFLSVLDLGAHDGFLGQRLLQDNQQRHVVSCDLSLPMIRLAPAPLTALVADEEMLPFAPESFDLIISNLSLHWVNDLPGTLRQIHSCLKPGGMFLATLFGESTLLTLRQAMVEAEMELCGGISPRLSPVIDLPTASGLLQRAGFDLPVTDYETILLSYPSPLHLLRDLRGMGENNAHSQRLRTATRRSLFPLACSKYPQHSRGRISAQFDVLFLHGWKETMTA